MIMDLGGSGATAPVAGGAEPENPVHPGVRVVEAITVPHWRQAEQIVPRIGLPAVTGKIEGTRGKLK
ncbi:hypothetical protein [Streptomyces alboniger]|uniref:hypothetical protein n=1 Tax=Streptomyces alboniger TaxID=132473 RepID=UPI000AC98F37|nr:hypothetical protein [Streptomyces alboniger]